MSFTARFIDSIHQVDQQAWDRLAGTEYPFIQYQYLAALEDSGCTSEHNGWQVNHLLVYQQSPAKENQLVAVVPCYLKHHSYGEYVFDWSWASAYQRAGKHYYPKLLTAIPFTPCAGPRICFDNSIDPGELFKFVTQSLQNYCTENSYSSAHILFTRKKENNELGQIPGWHERLGVQFQWHNRDYKNFESFLDELSSRKRKSIRKERRQVNNTSVEIRLHHGDQINEDLWERFYHCYQITYAKRSGHGGYLNKDFFTCLGKSMPEKVLLVSAWLEPDPENKLHRQLAELDQEVGEGKIMIASSLFIVGNKTLYGRYWGALQDIPGLHFECCYYQAIEYAIKHGLDSIDAGAQGEHKIQRGFEPLQTFSWHYLADTGFAGAVEDFLQHERQDMKMYLEQTRSLSPYKSQEPDTP